MKKSIGARWFANSFSVILLLLVVLNAAGYFILKNYYYYLVRQYLRSEADIICGVLLYDSASLSVGDSGGAKSESREVYRVVEEFDKKDRMELMVIDKGGHVDITSSGFAKELNRPGDTLPEVIMPDFDKAKQSGDSGEYVGIDARGDKYMAVSVMLHSDAAQVGSYAAEAQSAAKLGGFSAIRMVTSLDKIDAEIGGIILGMAAGSTLILMLLLFLGLYFINSIVRPIRDIESVAKRLAVGDFTVRLPAASAKNDDEIGQLVRIFNHLADELQNSDKIKNDFISGVSHELRTPLTAIKGWSETLFEHAQGLSGTIPAQSPDEDFDIFNKGMRIIINETGRLSDMVEELLDFSRIQSGRLILQKSRMDVLAELAETVLIYSERCSREGITLSYSEPQEIAVINGDKNRIKQVFINIIDNAVKYCKAVVTGRTGSGESVTVEANISDDTPTSGIVEIVVTDDGCGISEEDLPKVKQKFYKANNTVRGSGIGLAVADEIVTLHGGTLDISSRRGVGTSVKITLPIIR